MSGTETGPPAAQPPSPRASRRLSFWLEELPFALVLILRLNYLQHVTASGFETPAAVRTSITAS